MREALSLIWFDLVLEAMAEIFQIFQLLFWRIDDFINCLAVLVKGQIKSEWIYEIVN